MSRARKVWSEWQDYQAASGVWGPAVYQFRLARKGKPIAIRRLLTDDSDGILSVGETGSMESRRKKYCDAIRPGGYGHPAGKHLGLVAEFTLLRRRFRNPSFQYRFLALESKKAAKEKQDELLLRYILRFGEPPPLNSVIPDRWNEHGLWNKYATQIRKETGLAGKNRNKGL